VGAAENDIVSQVEWRRLAADKESGAALIAFDQFGFASELVASKRCLN